MDLPMSNGKPLELAISRAAREYRKQKRCVLLRQHTGVSNVGGFAEYTQSAPIDFLGVQSSGRALFVEAKSTEEASLPVVEDKFKAHQVATANTLEHFGALGWLVVWFERMNEVYAVPWKYARAFFSAPWRKSLPLHWMRAYGLLCPQSGGESSEPWKVWFLDGVAHEEREVALAAVAAERERAGGLVVSLMPAEPAAVTKGAESMTIDERKARIRKATEDSIRNLTRAEKGKAKWRTRRRVSGT